MASKLLQVALTQYGQEELRGAEHNPEILKYFSILGFDASKLGDETAWCSAFLNYCCLKVGLPYTAQLNARSWLNIGVPVTHPKPGDVVVFWRGENKFENIPGTTLKKGHVGIYINQVGDKIWVLGGNQSNQVRISFYSEGKLLGYRRLEF